MATQHEEMRGNGGEGFVEAGRQVREAAHQARDAARSAAGAISDKADSLMRGMERAKEQLLEGDVQSVRSDLESMIRERPLASLLVGAAVGYFFAKMIRR